MENLYCISGLGADERIFSRLHIEGVNLVHLSWVPFNKGDGIASYAEKMAALIQEPYPMILGIAKHI